jgi:hypothetical protein
MAGSCCQLPRSRQELWVVGTGCPGCGAEGRTVDTETVLAHVAPHATLAVTADQYRFCRTPECDVVYYGPSRTDVLSTSDVDTDVGCKHASVAGTVCYCFGHTAAEIATDVRDHGHSRIRESIVEQVRQENCRCRTANPSGRCCLAEVSHTVRSAQEAARPSPSGEGT